MNRVNEIINFESETTLVEESTIITALCFCLTEEEAVDLLLNVYRARLDLRNAALKKVCEDISNNFKNCHESLISTLLKEFDALNSRERQSAGYCLSELMKVLPTTSKRKVQKLLIQSKYIGVRRRGYKSLSSEKSIPVSFIEKAWNVYKDPECGWLIINKLPAAYLVKHRESLLGHLDEGWRISRLFVRIGSEYPSVVEELKEIDAISYCYVLAKLGLSLTEDEAKYIFNKSINDKRIGLLIWAYGRMRLWSVLGYIKKKLPRFQEHQYPTGLHTDQDVLTLKQTLCQTKKDKYFNGRKRSNSPH